MTITYAVLLGPLGLGMALASGLGGRDTAGRLVSGAYKAQEQSAEVEHDVETGVARAQQQAEQAKNESEVTAVNARRRRARAAHSTTSRRGVSSGTATVSRVLSDDEVGSA